MKLQCRDKECVSRTKNETAAFSVNVVVNDNGEIFENIKNFKGGFFSCVFCHDVAEWVNEENNVLTGESIEYTVKVDEFGNKFWYKNDKLHREDGPAFERYNGTKFWYINGKLHRLDGPACEYVNGDKEWYKNDKRHREDGPAIEYANGNKYWYKNNKLHKGK